MLHLHHPIHQMVVLPLPLQAHSLGHLPSSCPFQEYAAHAPLMVPSFLESALQSTCASALIGCSAALVKQTQQLFCRGFLVQQNTLGLAEDFHVFVEQTHGELGGQSVVGDQFQVSVDEVDFLELGLEDRFCRLLDAKVTYEDVPHSALDHLAEKEFLLSCSSVHPRTSLCKGCSQWFPSPQMQEFQIAPSANLRVGI